MEFSFYLGMIAAVITTVAFLPQVIKAHKTKKTGDLSLLMYVLFTIGVGLWAIYGAIIGSWPVLLSNIIIFALNLYILFLKIKHG
ncbi:MAG: SemiSWEET transporter [Deltaproteobacteria bacterium]|nr:SemiSWEET transporter [Deltaproteobacteria bacterium]MBI2342548.1 SemiSWEET transporter [Deltaproteobacteria bacterium]MBI2974566.1 SemiSWEET transporter [Deltaproteobacteria bacterium]